MRVPSAASLGDLSQWMCSGTDNTTMAEYNVPHSALKHSHHRHTLCTQQLTKKQQKCTHHINYWQFICPVPKYHPIWMPVFFCQIILLWLNWDWVIWPSDVPLPQHECHNVWTFVLSYQNTCHTNSIARNKLSRITHILATSLKFLTKKEQMR